MKDIDIIYLLWSVKQGDIHPNKAFKKIFEETELNYNKELISFNLKKLRIINDYTQVELSRLLQIKRCTYASYEESRVLPGIDFIIKICNFYKIKIDIFLSKEIK